MLVPESTKVPKSPVELPVVLVRPNPTPEITPDKVNCADESTLIELLAPKVTAPDKLVVPDVRASVPPFKVTASAPMLTPPGNCSLAPLATVVPLDVSPKPCAVVIAKMPPDTVVTPV